MATPTRFPASKSILLVWILNIIVPGLGNVYASGLSALRWLIIGFLIRVFVSHTGVLLGVYVLFSLIATGEIFAVSEPPKPPKKKDIQKLRSRLTESAPKAINAPSESLMSTFGVRHIQPPEDINELTDEFVRKHLEPGNHAEPNQAYEDLHAGQITYDALSSANTPYTFGSLAFEALSLPEPLKYEFPEFTFDSLDYQTVGASPPESGLSSGTGSPSCPHCGINSQNDFSFCLSCGHAYAIG